MLSENKNAVVDALKLNVTLESVAKDDTVSGSPSQGFFKLADFVSSELGVWELGVWELRGGTVTDTETDEIFVVIAGSASVTIIEGQEAGQVFNLEPGSVMRLTAGTKTKWITDDFIRKVYLAP